MPVLGYITYDDTKIDGSDSFGSVITALKPYSVYRNLKFYSPTTGDLNTWLQGNGVKMPLEGTWVWKADMAFSAYGPFPLNFMSNGNSYTKLDYDSDNRSMLYDSTVVATMSIDTNQLVYTDEAYRIITFTSPVQYTGNEEFVRWFVDNAQPGTILSLDMNWNDSGFDAIWLSSNSPAFLTYTSSNGTTTTEAPSSSITLYTIPANSVVTIYLPGKNYYAYPQLTGNYKNFTWITNPTTGHDAKFSFTVPQGEIVTLNAKVVTVAGVMTNLPS